MKLIANQLAGEPLTLHDPHFPLHTKEGEGGEINDGILYPDFASWMYVRSRLPSWMHSSLICDFVIRQRYIVDDSNRGVIGVNAGNNRQGDCYRFACDETSVS